jgi:hypothetical protein
VELLSADEGDINPLAGQPYSSDGIRVPRAISVVVACLRFGASYVADRRCRGPAESGPVATSLEARAETTKQHYLSSLRRR